MPNYYDDWQSEEYVCAKCSWSGTGAEAKTGELFSELYELDCPECGATLTVITYPTIEESKANWDKVSDADKAMVLARENFVDRFKMMRLDSPDDLPDIEGDELILVWDQHYGEDFDHETRIRYGEQILWSEPAIFEGIGRFGEVAAILKQKYGTRLKDLATTERSMNYLYGDRLSAFESEQCIRDRFWLPEPVQTEPDENERWLFGPHGQADYYGPWQTKTLVCENCEWAGKHKECTTNWGRNSAELNCPNCGRSVLSVTHPTLRKALALVLETDFENAEQENVRRQFLAAGYGKWLESTDQLPELDGEDLVFVWDDVRTKDGRELKISYGATTIWQEPCFYGCFSRFKTIATILQVKYGSRLKDLVPTRRSCVELVEGTIRTLFPTNSIRGDLWMNRVPGSGASGLSV